MLFVVIAVTNHVRSFSKKHLCNFNQWPFSQLVYLLLLIGEYNEFRPAGYAHTAGCPSTSQPYSSTRIHTTTVNCPSTVVVYRPNSFWSRSCCAGTSTNTLPAWGLPVSFYSAGTCRQTDHSTDEHFSFTMGHSSTNNPICPSDSRR